MSREPWHVQLRTREAPEDVDEEVEQELEEPASELEESGITVDDVDDTIAIYLANLETDEEDQADEAYGSGAHEQAD
jgi:hypothetical protein